MWSLWHKYISRLCSVHLVPWEMTVTEERTSPLSLPSCLCSVPGFFPGARLPPQPCRHTHRTHKIKGHGHGRRKLPPAPPPPMACMLSFSHFGSWNIHKASTWFHPPLQNTWTHLVAKENVGDCKLWPLKPSLNQAWTTNPGSDNPTMPCSRRTYSFSWASRSRTSASRLLTSMTSSSKSSCSRRFCASVFCQSGRWNGNMEES